MGIISVPELDLGAPDLVEFREGDRGVFVDVLLGLSHNQGYLLEVVLFVVLDVFQDHKGRKYLAFQLTWHHFPDSSELFGGPGILDQLLAVPLTVCLGFSDALDNLFGSSHSVNPVELPHFTSCLHVDCQHLHVPLLNLQVFLLWCLGHS